MKREAKEKYAEISEAIEQAEKAELDRILDDIASGSKKRLIRIRNNESDIEMITSGAGELRSCLNISGFERRNKTQCSKRIATTLSK